MSRTFAPHSLVRYNNPILVGTKTKDAKGVKTMRAKLEAGLSSTEQVLNSILPPREWTDGGKLWVQYVSSTPATTSDVLAVQQYLDAKLSQRQAKPSGICPVREELYSQCFDELIRQITINCAERGRLLLRMRDNIRMTVATYQKLYESGVAFGMLRSLQSEQNRDEMRAKVTELSDDVEGLQRKVDDWRARIQSMQSLENKRKAAALDAHTKETSDLRAANEKMSSELSQLFSVREYQSSR
jgi:dynein light intermediate chain